MKHKLFSPYQISSMSDAAIRKAYSQLRSVANKRLQRQQSLNIGQRARTGFRFPTIKDITESSKDTIASALADVSVFLRSPRTTVSGEKQFISRFQEDMEARGYGDLVQTPEDVYKMLEYMDALREEYGSKLFDSGDALDVLQEGERLNIPSDMLRDNFELFKSNLDKMEKLKPFKGNKSFSLRRLNYWKNKWTK